MSIKGTFRTKRLILLRPRKGWAFPLSCVRHAFARRRQRNPTRQSSLTRRLSRTRRLNMLNLTKLLIEIQVPRLTKQLIPRGQERHLTTRSSLTRLLNRTKRSIQTRRLILTTRSTLFGRLIQTRRWIFRTAGVRHPEYAAPLFLRERIDSPAITVVGQQDLGNGCRRINGAKGHLHSPEPDSNSPNTGEDAARELKCRLRFKRGQALNVHPPAAPPPR